VLLADAAGAAVLEPSDDERGIIDFDLYSDGQYWDLLYMPGGGSRHPTTKETVEARMHYAKMKGNEVFKVAVRCSWIAPSGFSRATDSPPPT